MCVVTLFTNTDRFTTHGVGVLDAEVHQFIGLSSLGILSTFQ